MTVLLEIDNYKGIKSKTIFFCMNILQTEIHLFKFLHTDLFQFYSQLLVAVYSHWVRSYKLVYLTPGVNRKKNILKEQTNKAKNQNAPDPMKWTCMCSLPWVLLFFKFAEKTMLLPFLLPLYQSFPLNLSLLHSFYCSLFLSFLYHKIPPPHKSSTTIYNILLLILPCPF